MDVNSLEAPSVALQLDSNYPFDSVGWSNTQVSRSDVELISYSLTRDFEGDRAADALS